ncbi:MAG: ferric-dicitrate binding protein FerR (iron transport regulator) [Roseivirga sp.]|jgi:ferric-dicitrate binding protein FerR (iron transport regulator)
MSNNKHHKNSAAEQEQKLFSALELNYKKSKADVWASMEGMMDEPTVPVEEVLAPLGKTISWIPLSIAASIILFLSCGLFAKLYTTTIPAGAGELVNHTLPDGSIVYMNAASSISYTPYWWTFNREVTLEGEAFFEVEKGEKFSVKSDYGITQVLGTKFNIYARGKAYEVFCESGKVKVSDAQAASVLLLPGEFVALEEGKTIEKQTDNVSASSILSWRRGQFMYNTTPFLKVFADIERQYGVTILLENKSIGAESYTGVFDKPADIGDALQIVCTGFGLGYEITYEMTSENSYVIRKK